MAQMTDDWTARHEQLVLKILRQRDWQLIAQDELPAFVKRVEENILDGTVNPRPGTTREDTVHRATIYAYCRELYRASGEDGTLRQRRAFEEIAKHAQGVTFRYEQNPDTIKACIQSALQIVWEKRGQVREPGSFLRWIEQVVYHEIKGYWKETHRRREVPMSRLVPMGENEENEELALHVSNTLTSLPPEDEIAGCELREQLWAEVWRALAGNQRYQAIIIG